MISIGLICFLICSPFFLLMFLGLGQQEQINLFNMNEKYLEESYEVAEYLHEYSKDKKKIDFLDIFTYAMMNSKDWEKFDKKTINDIRDNAEKGVDIIDYENPSFVTLKNIFSNVIGDLVGDYELMEIYNYEDKEGFNRKKIESKEKWGLKAYYPVPRRFRYTHHNDFGAGRSFGGDRKHEGNDIMARVGVPLVAVESGHIEKIGWNKFGGWRIGIRSEDGNRYYYYGHMKQYAYGMEKGKKIQAGEVIGYCGDSGYGSIGTTGKFAPHLHIQIQVDYEMGEKKESVWINPYPLLKFIERNKTTVEQYENDEDEYMGVTQIK